MARQENNVRVIKASHSFKNKYVWRLIVDVKKNNKIKKSIEKENITEKL
jgi:hypothetical protein